MKTQQKNKLIVSLLALLLTVALTVIGTVIVAGDPVPTNTLTITEATNCTVIVSVNEVPVSGNEGVYEIAYGSTVKVTINPTWGYEISNITGSDNPVVSNNYFTISTFNKDANYSITCTTRTFDISYLPERVGETIGTDPLYTFVESRPNTLTYKGESVTVPDPIRTGYSFQYWELVSAAGTSASRLVGGELKSDLTLTEENVSTGKLYLRPVFEPNLYPVAWLDYVYDETSLTHKQGDKLGQITKDGEGKDLTLLMDTVVNNQTDGPATTYPGYKLSAYQEEGFTNPKINVSTPESPNLVYRYFDPLVYTLSFDLASGTLPIETVLPETHTYNQDTALPTPERTGYTFSGWSVKVGETVLPELVTGSLTAKNENYAAAEGTVIYLTASWTANEYGISYDVNEVGGGTITGAPMTHTYDSTSTMIPDPVRSGYTFLGWYLNGNDAELLTSTEGVYNLPAATLPEPDDDTINLVAVWEAIQYTVTLDGNGEGDTVTDGDTQLLPTYDADVPSVNAIPSRVGYTFLGFFTKADGGTQYIDETGAGVGTWTETEVTTLYAHWKVNSYKVSIDLFYDQSLNNDFTNNTVLVNGIPYTGEAVDVDYRATITVEITAETGYKITKWLGSDVDHVKATTFEYQLTDAENKSLEVTLRATHATPTFFVDYENELICWDGKFPDNSSFVLTNGIDTLNIVIALNGTMTLNGLVTDTITVPESFFGSTVTAIQKGALTGADSDPQELAVAARPNAPTVGNGEEDEISNSPAYKDQYEIRLTVNKAKDDRQYEFAITKVEGDANLQWQDSSVFSNLTPGTVYYVYVRVKASATYPCGAASIFNESGVITAYDDAVAAAKAELDRLKEEYGAGEQVTAVIDAAKADIDELEPSASFYEELQGIVDQAKIDVVAAKDQDDKIAALDAKLKAKLESGAYNEDGKTKLKQLHDEAKQAVLASDDETYTAKSDEMDRVPINYLTATEQQSDSEIRVTSQSGMDPDAKLHITRDEETKDLIKLVTEAIEAGRVLSDGGSKAPDGLAEELRAKIIQASYYLTFSDAIATGNDYEITLLLPEELRGEAGLQVAYYDPATKSVVVLDTRVEEDHLIFNAAGLMSELVVFSDETLSLTGLIILLGAVLLCQFIALALILARRSKYKTVRANAFAPILPLTVHFLPASGMTVVMILGGLAVIMQILIIWLLISSAVVRRKKEEENVVTVDESQAVFAMSESEENEEEPPLTALTEEEIAEEERYEEYDESEQPVSDYENDAPFAEYDDAGNETVGRDDNAFDDDFIEPAANPRYSLPDDGSSYEEARPEDEEWSFDDSEKEPAEEDLPAEDAENSADAEDSDGQNESTNEKWF